MVNKREVSPQVSAEQHGAGPGAPDCAQDDTSPKSGNRIAGRNCS